MYQFYSNLSFQWLFKMMQNLDLFSSLVVSWTWCKSHWFYSPINGHQYSAHYLHTPSSYLLCADILMFLSECTASLSPVPLLCSSACTSMQQDVSIRALLHREKSKTSQIQSKYSLSCFIGEKASVRSYFYLGCCFQCSLFIFLVGCFPQIIFTPLSL